MNLSEKVERGAALLDIMRPGWHDVIDKYTIDIKDPYLCILGQLYGHYANGLAAMWDFLGDEAYRTSGSDFGFSVSLSEQYILSSVLSECSRLKSFWITQIDARRTKVNVV